MTSLNICPRNDLVMSTSEVRPPCHESLTPSSRSMPVCVDADKSLQFAWYIWEIQERITSMFVWGCREKTSWFPCPYTEARRGLIALSSNCGLDCRYMHQFSCFLFKRRPRPAKHVKRCFMVAISALKQLKYFRPRSNISKALNNCWGISDMFSLRGILLDKLFLPSDSTLQLPDWDFKVMQNKFPCDGRVICLRTGVSWAAYLSRCIAQMASCLNLLSSLVIPAACVSNICKSGPGD